MSRGIPVDELPPSVQTRARALAGGVSIELGPNSPLRDAAVRRKPAEDREHPIQIAIVEWADDPATLPDYPELKALYAIPNALGAGGKRSKRQRQIEGARRKAEGRRKGMLDLVLPAPRRDRATGAVFGGLYLEIKDEQGTLGAAQRDRIRILRAAGNRCDVAMSVDAAIAIITQYLELPKP